LGWGLALTSSSASALDLTVDSGAASDCSGQPLLHAAAAGYLEPAPLTTVNQYGGNQYAPSAGNDIGVGVAFAEVSAAAPRSAWAFCIAPSSREPPRRICSIFCMPITSGNRSTMAEPITPGTRRSRSRPKGLRLRRAFDLGELAGFNFKLDWAASLLDAAQGRQQSLTGTVTATSPSYAVGTATWLRTDSDLNPNDFNPFVGPGHPSGLGFSTDFELKVTSPQGAALDVIVMDGGGRIYWHGTRNSLLMANNATVAYNADFNREAFVTGVDSRIDEVEHIPTKYHVAFSQPVLGNSVRCSRTMR